MASKLDAFAHLLGKVPDERIAEMAGVKVETVAKRRRELGADEAAELVEVAVEVAEAVRTAAPASAKKPAAAAEPRAFLLTEGVRINVDGVERHFPRSVYRGALAERLRPLFPDHLVEEL